ncbi:polar amino acid transport system permease protein [Nocardiopsis arvandica]|uniref:Polar amino acid transport system permease protein n=1 Tax=Nocardiopsis sinuspersici TaxID=501010 RepID=A0A7Y9XEW8_9ACTN|nr:ectoine/hydroxyectoine ABC transporter permease subunit EhuD [Nocardiopsis sinuspersici]NYH53485.1 polar amino acid transport system permease protein [Nocardiopsis sinuspersici]
MFDAQWIFQILPDLLSALMVNVQITVFGYLIALVVGLLIAMARRVPFFGAVLHAVTEFIRTTPLIVQAVFVFLLTPAFISPLTVGIVVIGVHYSAYTAEVYRSGIEGVAKGQWEAARALSLPARRTWGAIVLPQAIRKVIPALGNYLIATFKDTPLLIAIGVGEVLTVARQIGSASFRVVEVYTIVGFLFLLVTIPSAIILRRLERRYAAV